MAESKLVSEASGGPGRDSRRLTRAALLLAVMLTAQSLRMVVPIPVVVSMFVIGPVVNASLLLTVESAGWRLALLTACIAPVVSFMQQALPVPALIIPVAAANIGYAGGYALVRGYNRQLAIITAVAVKFVALWFCAEYLLELLELPGIMIDILRNMMGISQIVTGVAGGILCVVLIDRLKLAAK